MDKWNEFFIMVKNIGGSHERKAAVKMSLMKVVQISRHGGEVELAERKISFSGRNQVCIKVEAGGIWRH